VISAACIAALVSLRGPLQLGAAFVLGATMMMALVGWGVGDVHALPWLWGSIGEQATADALARLDGSWVCEHDLVRDYGNWDHIAVGPPGVFLFETKRLTRRVVVRDDALQSGRIRLMGGSFRAAAAAFADELAPRCGTKPWVQAVVVIWGEFPQRCHEEDRVTYLHGDELLGWLLAQPSRLSEERTHRLGAAVRALVD